MSKPGWRRGILGDVARGQDVAEDRIASRKHTAAEAAAEKLTLTTLLEQWSDLALINRRPSCCREAVRALKTAFPSHLNRRSEYLSRAGAAMAGRTMAYGRACYGSASKRGKVPENPFSALPIVAGTSSRDRVLTDAEVALVWHLAPKLGWPFGPLMQVLLLTAQRREEVAGMTWAELSPDLTTWSNRKERTKNGRAHVVHLAAVRAILADVPQLAGIDLVFTTNFKTAVSGFSRAKARLDALIDGHLRVGPLLPAATYPAQCRLGEFMISGAPR